MEKSILALDLRKGTNPGEGNQKKKTYLLLAGRVRIALPKSGENRAKILPENSNLGLERGLGRIQQLTLWLEGNWGRLWAAHGYSRVLVPVPDILQCPLKLPTITPGEGSSPFLHTNLPHPHLSGTEKTCGKLAMTRLLEAPCGGASPPLPT